MRVIHTVADVARSYSTLLYTTANHTQGQQKVIRCPLQGKIAPVLGGAWRSWPPAIQESDPVRQSDAYLQSPLVDRQNSIPFQAVKKKC